MCKWEQLRRTGNRVAWRTEGGKTWGKGLGGEVYLKECEGHNRDDVCNESGK